MQLRKSVLSDGGRGGGPSSKRRGGEEEVDSISLLSYADDGWHSGRFLSRD